MAAPQDHTKGILQHPKPDNVAQEEAGDAVHDAATDDGPPQAVRFSSMNEEIEPSQSIQVGSIASERELSPDAQEELRNLSQTLSNTRLQGRRMSNFAFEPVSLPASRVASNETEPRHVGGEAPQTYRKSPRPSPSSSAVNSPSLEPLTPAATPSRDTRAESSAITGSSLAKVHPDPATVTPQISGPHDTSPPVSLGKVAGNENEQASSAVSSRPSSASERMSTDRTSVSNDSNAVSSHPKSIPAFFIGPTGDSLPLSRDQSPSGTSTPSVQPFPPTGDKDDPYARNKRPPQSRNLDGIDPRFIFSAKDGRNRSSPANSSSSVPRLDGGAAKATDEGKHSHSFLHSKGHHHNDGASSPGNKSGSATDLKRFFRIGHKNKRTPSPAKSPKSGTRTPPHQLPSSTVPFADDHGLSSKYGKFGKVLGSGAGGSVRLLKRSSDGVTFAVKEFRDRHPYETEKEYGKKVTAEFCIGSTLHHGNIIETLDIIHEKGKWYEVMEYAPYDLFAAVMTGKMTREEVTCSFLQIVSGVTYLHSMGLAHRDLKLDNVVVNDRGIMKLIDFGSATVFRYPFENDIVLAQGIVGSDPYLAPEVYDNRKYDPQPTDIWSLAIIFCCMSLRRFPWKAPRMTDTSYKLFASPPNIMPDRPRSTADLPSKRFENDLESNSMPPSRQASEESTSTSGHHHHHHPHHPKPESEPATRSGADGDGTTDGVAQSQASSQAPTVIRGPWRLLRLLPRESRSIIGDMLQIDPKKRAKLLDVLSDPWIAGSPVCRQEEGGKVINVEGHIHTLIPSAGVEEAASKK